MHPSHRLALAIFVCTLTACKKSSPSSADIKPPSHTPEPVLPIPAAPTSAPALAPATAAVDPSPAKTEPAAPPKVLAPEGTLFAVERISVTTDDGVFTIPAGSRLKIVRKEADGYIVKNDRHQFAVEAHQVTNEVGVASAAAQTHLAEQAAVAEAVRNQTAVQMEALRLQKTQDVTDARLADRQRRRAALEERNLKLVGEIAALRTRIDQGYSAAERAYYPCYNRVGTSTVDPNVRAGWQRRLAEALEEERSIETELSRLRSQHE
jgi:hypothetical protein